MVIFNRQNLKQNRNRAAKNFHDVDFINNEISEIIFDTITDCKRNFNSILEIGAKNGKLGKQIFITKNATNLIQADLSIKMAESYQLDLVMDDENLCFKEQSFDLIISNLNLHSINEIPQNLITIKKLLKPDGLFVCSFFGEENLKELRESIYQVEQEIYGGITPRIAPNIDIKSAGMLLQKAGFTDVVTEKHSLEVEYSNPKTLLDDLKKMGESNILNAKSRKFFTKKFLFNLTNLYQKLYFRSNNKYLATFEIIILSGWKTN